MSAYKCKKDTQHIDYSVQTECFIDNIVHVAHMRRSHRLCAGLLVTLVGWRKTATANY